MYILPAYTYGATLSVFLVLEILFAELERRRQDRINSTFVLPSETNLPRIAALLPFYNEDIGSLCACVDSLLVQQYPKDKFDIVIVDDGSHDPKTFETIRDKYANEPQIRMVRSEKNCGKRQGQFTALDNVPLGDKQHEYVITLDSDTTFSQNCLKELLTIALNDSADAVSGVVLARESQPGWLNYLLRVRYWNSNNQERASQSFFDQVLCCSGPCVLWKRDIFSRLRNDYLNQFFMGERCSFGDDRHMTNLFLREGCKTKIALRAVAHTDTPTGVWKWVKQQERWSKSFYRESLFYALHVRHMAKLWPVIFNIYSFALPMLLATNILTLVLFHLSPSSAASFLASITAAGYIRGAYGYALSRKRYFAAAPVYGFVHFALVVPVRIWALFRLNTKKWGTR